MPRYDDVPDGWFAITKRGWRLKCCDCALTHVLDFRTNKGQLEVRIERHERATKAARRALRKNVVIVVDE